LFYVISVLQVVASTVGFEVLTALLMKIQVFWNYAMSTCKLLLTFWRNIVLPVYWKYNIYQSTLHSTPQDLALDDHQKACFVAFLFFESVW